MKGKRAGATPEAASGQPPGASNPARRSPGGAWASAGAAAWLTDLTSPDIAARLPDAVLLLPVGAAAKEHGPHLPLGTDHRIAAELARRIAEALPVLVLPPVTYGYYPAFRHWPGSTHLSAATFEAVIVEIGASLARHGGRRIAVINAGVSTEAPLQLAARRLREDHGAKVAVADIRRLGRRADGVLDTTHGGHADERETSVMMALAPEAVRAERLPPDSEAPAPASPGQGVFHWPVTLSRAGDRLFDPDGTREVTASGATGAPSRATAEKGAAVLDAMAADLADGLCAAFPDVLGA